jgi:shikimate dehydrogenase
VKKRFAVIGDPIAHSKSPAMHAAAYRALGMPHRYEALRVGADDLSGVVGRLQAGVFDGLNVTVPHKQRVLEMVQNIDESAALVGAANTLVRATDGAVTAHNTDAPALAHELSRLGAAGGASALVIGSGGAARSAIVALAARLGFARVVVRARAFASGGAASAFRSDVTRRLMVVGCDCAIETQTLEPLVEAFSVVVQCTSAGMPGADGGDGVAGAVVWNALAPGAVAIDVVYAPNKTAFVSAAEAASVPCVDGLGMLVEQGARAFELWLGVAAPRKVMRDAIV